MSIYQILHQDSWNTLYKQSEPRHTIIVKTGWSGFVRQVNIVSITKWLSVSIAGKEFENRYNMSWKMASNIQKEAVSWHKNGRGALQISTYVNRHTLNSINNITRLGRLALGFVRRSIKDRYWARCHPFPFHVFKQRTSAYQLQTLS